MKPSSTIDSFLNEILQSIRTSNPSRLTEFIVLNFDSLPPARRQPYEDLHKELNARFPPNVAGKDAALSTTVKQSLTQDVLRGCQTSFTEVVIIYFRYVRDFTGDSPLMKARKIEKLTRQCILTLRDDQPGPLFIPLVLHLTSTLRLVAINLDRDPTLTSTTSNLSATDEGGSISFVENTGNILREAFNKCIQRSRPTVPPSPSRLDSGLYLILNGCMSLYTRAGKLRNAEFLLGMLDKTSPPLSYYPAAQRVSYLYFLGRFHFGANHFFRATRALQAAYDQCSKRSECAPQRRQILTYLIAAGMCIGRLPSRILMLDQAAHGISKPFLEVSKLIKAGDVARFHEVLDYTTPKNESARWLLAKGVLLQLRNRCEVLAWRSLVLKSMRYGGHFPGEASRAIPTVKLEVIMRAARFSYSSARAQAFVRGGQAIDLSGNGSGEEHDYVDPDFVEDDEDEEGNGSGGDNGSVPAFGAGMFGSSQPQSQSNTPATSIHEDHVDHLSHYPPNDETINSIVLSLVSQGLIKGFVTHEEDLLQSRLAIRGAKTATWQQMGFPPAWKVISEKEEAHDDGNVPGWVTEEKVRQRQASQGGGFVVNLSGARPVGMG